MDKNYISVGASTEDETVFEDKGQLLTFNKEWVFAIKEADNMSVSVKEAVDIFTKGLYDMRDHYQTNQEFLTAVDSFVKEVENKQGVFFTWGVEYDWNLMFVENVTKEELVDILDKMEVEED